MSLFFVLTMSMCDDDTKVSDFVWGYFPTHTEHVCPSKFLCKGTSGCLICKVKPVVPLENLHTCG